ncbi:alpha/beta hydrolase [Calidifontibacter sp. DB0510]|uniref:Alpha/beta hydrolase n=1 Tax=Metallococcus carri TaxID=1656884 RepID=A0A967B184_9MICO|nr:alpha/beta hydrolase [Metallococcus carri]NOP37676.1 alpha/beta fold hydrolase [Calidifontibacter sp. DB2511S]
MLTAAATAGSGAIAGSIGAVGVAAYFARRVVTPEPPADDTTVRSFTDLTVTLAADAATTAPGRYGLWATGGSAHVRLGEVMSVERKEVTRELLGVDFGELSVGPARFNGYFYAGPPAQSLGVQLADVVVDGPLGGMPAWESRVLDSRRWAVLVHGRGAHRAECLRAVEVLDALGINTLTVSYRNDPGCPAAPDGLYNLGLSEWQDVDAAIAYAEAHGAEDVQLFGWSMGGATVLQTADRSPRAALVSRLVLDAPVVDWGNVLAFQAGLNHLPPPIGRVGQKLLSSRRLHRRAVGLGEPLDLARADWVTRADDLTKPVLLIHSRDDDFVPFGPSQDLAHERPDLVRLEAFDLAGHCREWNVDSERWERLVRAFCAPQLVP